MSVLMHTILSIGERAFKQSVAQLNLPALFWHGRPQSSREHKDAVKNARTWPMSCTRFLTGGRPRCVTKIVIF
jgi:hypothetical protein